MRIDAALNPPGFIASATMYSLIYRDQKLYVIYTGPGPASRHDYEKALKQQRLHQGALENLAVGALMKRYVRTIQANEARITDENLDALVDEEKKSVCFDKSEITDVKVKETAVTVRITFKGAGKKYKLDCSPADKAALTELAALLTPSVV